MQCAQYEKEFSKKFYKVPKSFFNKLEFRGLRKAGGCAFVGFFLDLYFSAIEEQDPFFIGKDSIEQFAKEEKLNDDEFKKFLCYCLNTGLLTKETNRQTTQYFMPMAKAYLDNVLQRKGQSLCRIQEAQA